MIGNSAHDFKLSPKAVMLCDAEKRCPAELCPCLSSHLCLLQSVCCEDMLSQVNS